MMLRFRPLAAIAMALLLVLTAQSMAVARGMPGAAGSVVLCTGTGPVTILTDAEGQPVGPAHICPDCTLSLIVMLAQGSAVATRPLTASLLDWPATGLQVHAQAVQPFSARDPPAVM
ncbi:MAG: hypothetical protein QUV10_10020 [Paracoccaceae bacterium]|jgi:hypothetical protein|uniref:hypothetical protein n=1 Tax=unclassified Seohaeicola TaxID=2641111 RepID=UPI00237B31FC|nr:MULTISPECIES: hypothetical protein [unclassified Seohaeicola]MDD9707409.1 hypothetical protein [Seohaeicola sp. 4SK31]MDD9735616.1 hypothetical protein [Seohaeicola sp. SP36]MDM7969945.1 hypothetical protein [Paracoccaceae bacterium]